MPLSANILMALAAAVLWGGGDFSGGMGVKRAGGSLRAALRVVLMSHAASLSILLIAAAVRGDPFPHGAPLAWGLAAGLVGGLALTGFYVALARGAMGGAASVSGLMAAALPALLGMGLDGSPGVRPLLGFAMAGLAIWLIAGGAGPRDAPVARDARSTTLLAIAAGAGFGLYFIALKFAGPAGVIWPMATARMGSLTVCSVLTLAVAMRRSGAHAAAGQAPSFVTGTVVLWAMSVALLDTAGNMLFVAATRAGRLDVAAVLASLYPASTILLAAMLLREHPTRRQLLGMSTAAIAVVLIAL